jgi:hypothetical protein
MKSNFTKNILLIAALGLALCIAPRVNAAANSWSVLSLQEQTASGWTHSLDLYATNCVGNVTNAASANGNTLFPVLNNGTINFPANTRIGNIGILVDKAFHNGAAAGSNWILNVGDSTVTNRYVSALDIGTNQGTGVYETNLSTGLWGVNGRGWVDVDNRTNRLYTTATNLTFHVHSTNAANTTLTSGRLQIFLRAVPYNDYRSP